MRIQAAVLLLLALPLFAQRFDDTITVNIVDVPVYVERFGVPVEGLTREDFELFVDGKPQPIEYFDVVDERAGAAKDATAAAAAAPDLKLRRLIVLLFDVSAPAYSLQRARLAALKYVADGAPGDTWAVATIGHSEARFITAFTPDRIAVQRAIATLAPSKSRDPFRVATLDDERTRWTGTVGGAEAGLGSFADVWGDQVAPGGVGVSTAAANAVAFQQTAQDLENMETESLDTGFIENLAALADRLAPLEGIKQVVLLSERRGPDDDRGPVLQRATRMHARYRAAGVILNGVDIQPPQVPAGDAISTDPSPRGRDAMPSALPSNFLYTLALDTGGIVTNSLPQLLARNRTAYVLGFRAPDGMTRSSIRVHVKRVPPLTDVRYRKSFDVAAEQDGDKGLFLADTLLNDIPQNGVTLDLAVKGSEVVASIPGVELLAYPWDEPLRLEVFFYVFKEEQRPFAWNLLEVSVDLQKGREFLSAHPYTIRHDLALAPGQYTVKVLVRIAGRDRVGFQRVNLTVPAS